MGRAPVFLAVLSCVMMTGCTTYVQAPKSSIGQVHAGAPGSEPQADAVAQLSNQKNVGVDLAIEDEVSTVCVAAWRKSLAGDLKGAMADLDAESQKYPNVGTINFMRGQILDHSGKKSEAIEFYQKAITDKEFSTIYAFKLAEALRETHRDKEAVTQYRRLLKSAPDFVPGKIGLAKSLLASAAKSSEARELLESALKSAKEENNSKAAADAETTLEKSFGKVHTEKPQS